jgi:hypothetical protein
LLRLDFPKFENFFLLGYDAVLMVRGLQSFKGVNVFVPSFERAKQFKKLS